MSKSDISKGDRDNVSANAVTALRAEQRLSNAEKTYSMAEVADMLGFTVDDINDAEDVEIELD